VVGVDAPTILLYNFCTSTLLHYKIFFYALSNSFLVALPLCLKVIFETKHLKLTFIAIVSSLSILPYDFYYVNTNYIQISNQDIFSIIYYMILVLIVVRLYICYNPFMINTINNWSDINMSNDTEYVTNTEVRRMLDEAGKSLSTFYRYVNKGEITALGSGRHRSFKMVDIEAFLQGKHSQNGRKKGYIKQSSDSIQGNSATPSTQEFLIDTVRRHADVGAAYTVEAGLLGWGEAIKADVINSWQSKNDHAYWLLRNPDDNDVWAVLGILPLREETIFQLLRGELLIRDIQTDDILSYEPGGEFNCYITSAATIPEHPDSIVPLLQHVLSYWCETPQIYINKLYFKSDVTVEDTPLLRLASEYNCFMISDFSDDHHVSCVLYPALYNPSLVIRNFQKCQSDKKERTFMSITMPTTNNSLEEIHEIRFRGTGQDGYFTKDARFRFANSKDDIREIVRVNRALFGSGSSLSEDDVVSLLLSWWEVNNEVFQVMVYNNVIVGYVSLLPLPLEIINGLMSDDIRVSQIRAEDVEPFKPSHPVNLYVWTVGLHPDYQEPLQLKRTLGRYISQGVIGLFEDFGKRGIEVQSAWTRSDTLDGQGLSNGLGFEAVIPTPSKSGKPVFKLDVAWSNKNYLVMYMQKLIEYRSRRLVKSTEQNS